MMKRFIFIFALFVIQSISAQNPEETLREVAGVIQRFVGKIPIEMSLSIEKEEGKDVFELTESEKGLSIKGSSGVALCRGFYHSLKNRNAGICSWSGNRIDKLAFATKTKAERVVSPFQHHYYLNVVTYGYSMPYWDWERWEREIDWMALHGIDMPLALVGNEAISARVWRKLGLTDEEINAYFVGPAHLPWMRMGNISGIDSPLSHSWHQGQINLQHRILKRMKALGMKPVCPGFAGFVPKALQRLFPEIKLIETSWGNNSFHNWMLPPDQELFHRMGKMFIEEWEKEFGENEYYLVDSFNEMELPFFPKDPDERYELLANYGEQVYKSISDGNPKATWVMQGWMFGYQCSIWDFKTLQALLSRVPDDKMLLLDLAEDYNHCFWKNGANWEYYEGFFNKQWIYSVIPNMGGKVAMTGDLEFYANGGRLEVLSSPNKGKLVGFGFAPEGVENNEVIYELLADAGWAESPINLDEWLLQYSMCRYGDFVPSMEKYWKGLLQSAYGSFTDHPRFIWQFRPGTVKNGTVCTNDNYYAAIESFAEAASVLGDSELYRIDLIEMVAQYISGKLETLIRAIEKNEKVNKGKVDFLKSRFIHLFLGMDRLLESHPNHRLERWIEHARKQGSTEQEKMQYEKNARRIVTIWGPPVDDYSARIWSGLIRDYYLLRWINYFDSKSIGRSFDFEQWERYWVEDSKRLSKVTPYVNTTEACLKLLKEAKEVHEHV